MVFRRVDFGPQQLLPPHRIALMSSRRLLPSPWYDLGLGFPGFLAGDEGKVLTISPGCGGRAHRSNVKHRPVSFFDVPLALSKKKIAKCKYKNLILISLYSIGPKLKAKSWCGSSAGSLKV